ncbi:dual specificity mitogen-activated protein kinase kinase 7-like isoform X2 [Coccinella septempunctata]|uniref:dual specificity mitogen-activated protein kinase kinase 7-like isoform X2 n=1 Tax=Coccinella septempunctata TaxID=41139 RepID=UPI001D091959|nr:dual specificity mitogen-activated protein kinase kinase 7-like isoform X2 [Coccinella septempunctata]
MSSQEKIDEMLNRIRQPNGLPTNGIRASPGGGTSPNRRNLSLPMEVGEPRRVTPRPNALKFTINRQQNIETETKLKEIMKISGKLKINNIEYNTDIKDLELIEELGHGTCGHVYKMKHKKSNEIIAVKQMRRSGNSEENKRIIMDIEVVLKSHDCKFIVQCLGCFITESEVWICMELMATCFDKLLKKLKKPIPERILGKVTVATVEALSYLKDKHGVMHRDVKPSNILLDEKGNVKLCDFGISGRLVDSMAKTRSAGCAAYMAPERIEPNPENPDYDVRADVWSLGITLVELATGVFPYQDCKTDFEVLAKVINQDPPSLPKNKGFSSDFQDFVSCCLRKQHQSRPKYRELKKHAFIKKYETEEVNVGKWFIEAVDEADRSANRQSLTPSAFRRFFTSQQPQAVKAASAATPPFTPLPVNGNAASPYRLLSDTPPTSDARPTDPRATHSSRLGAFQSLTGQRARAQPVEDAKPPPNGLRETNYFVLSPKRDSPLPLPGSLRDDAIKFGSPVLPRRQVDSPLGSPYPQKRGVSESRWRTPNTSPLPLRANQPGDADCCCSNTSPIVFQRFIHQQKQQQLAKEAEEEAKYNPGTSHHRLLYPHLVDCQKALQYLGRLSIRKLGSTIRQSLIDAFCHDS